MGKHVCHLLGMPPISIEHCYHTTTVPSMHVSKYESWVLRNSVKTNSQNHQSNVPANVLCHSSLLPNVRLVVHLIGGFDCLSVLTVKSTNSTKVKWLSWWLFHSVLLWKIKAYHSFPHDEEFWIKVKNKSYPEIPIKSRLKRKVYVFVWKQQESADHGNDTNLRRWSNEISGCFQRWWYFYFF